jgi:hypothetical protein
VASTLQPVTCKSDRATAEGEKLRELVQQEVALSSEF